MDIAAVEDAILARLRTDVPLAAVVRTIRAYQGEGADGRERVAVLLPAVLVGYAGGPISPRASVDFLHEAAFEVLVLTSSQRGPTQARSGAPEAGSYAIIQHLLRRLSGAMVVEGADELVPYGVDPHPNTPSGQSWFVLRFTMRLRLDQAEADLQADDAAAVADLETAAVEHLLPDGSGTASIVTDTVELA